jgi:SAM-dependent methyltransferase
MNIDPKCNDMSYSVRRYFVDEFHARHMTCFPEDSLILDVGGRKSKKRGQFNIEKYALNVKYVNLDEKAKPDCLCDIADIAVKDNTFDGVVCSEVIEHVPDPKAVLKEINRVLKPGGILLLCAPFMFKIHADPQDYGRYTDFFYRFTLKEMGFEDIYIEKQGLFWSVLANMIKLFAYEMLKENKPQNRLIRSAFHKIVSWSEKKALKFEKKKYFQQHNFFSSFTTGFGVVAKKR